jgi:hypothetical protein
MHPPPDRVIAAFGRHRFAGYGTIRSEFRRDGPSLAVMGDDGYRNFRESFGCDWVVLHDPAYVKCSHLKRLGRHIDFQRGACVARIDRKTFCAIKHELDAHGAAPIETGGLHSTLNTEIDDEGDLLEGEERLAFRKHRTREMKYRKNKIAEALAAHGTLRCEVPDCGFDFLKTYGPIGEGYAQVHHLIPLAENGPRKTKMEHLAIVCANCHVMIHRYGQCRPLHGLLKRTV